MEIKYRSKIGIEIIIILMIVFGYSSAVMIKNHVWVGLVINLLVISLIGYVFKTTYYTITGNSLIIQCGFIYKSSINIARIKKIKETYNPLGSPAASIDRIAIYYNNKDFVMISPKSKMKFINQLLSINSNIEIKLRKNKSQDASSNRR